ncbi:MAG: VOC family protein [Acidimicrobiia bacterium]|jgi:catechol 2,3-dioxygenase-like lactoylglutathione lyase family enzyme|nr:VOC family protein [Acidimicrobiia bacterium]MDQ3389925.1 VOC family protein [Actinomycetota bacterium]
MNWTLEVVCVPVTDVDRAKAFYAEQLGFNVDHDSIFSEESRVVQLTPPGSGCSIVVGTGVVPAMPPGMVQGLQLVVPDVKTARAELAGRGVDITEVQVYDEDGLRPVRDGDELNNVGFCFFSDPDGNGWAVQQINARA